MTCAAPGELAGKTVGVIGGMAARHVGILAGAGTLLAQIYQPVMRARGIACLAPPPAGQEIATRAIHGPAAVKGAGAHSAPARADLIAAAASVLEQGADALLLACLEFFALHEIAPLELGVPVVDAAESVARHVVWLAMQCCQHTAQATP